MKIREESIEILERIFSAGKDAPFPAHPVHDAVLFKGSLDGFHLEGRFGLREYDDAETLYDALLVVYYDVLHEDDPEGALLRDLAEIAPGAGQAPG